MKKNTKSNFKRKAVLERIQHLEDAIAKGHEYLETGKHAHWHGFRPLFVDKVRNGEILPPHKDWIKSTFLPWKEKALKIYEKKLERLS